MKIKMNKREKIEEAAKLNAIYELENNYKPTKESFKLACKRSFIKGIKLQEEQITFNPAVDNYVAIEVTFENEKNVKQTAVEWLSDVYKKRGGLYNSDIENAKELEKQQSIDFANWVNENAYKYPTKTSTEELFEEFKKK